MTVLLGCEWYGVVQVPAAGMAASGFLRLTWSVPGLTELLSPAQIPAPLGSSRHSSVTGSALVSPSTSSSRGSFSPLDPCFVMFSSSPLSRVIGEDMVEFLSTTTSECTCNLKYLKQRANTCVCTYSAIYLYEIMYSGLSPWSSQHPEVSAALNHHLTNWHHEVRKQKVTFFVIRMDNWSQLLFSAWCNYSPMP